MRSRQITVKKYVFGPEMKKQGTCSAGTAWGEEIIYLLSRHCLAMCSGSAVASKAFSTLALNAIRLSISVTKLASLSSSSFFQYLMSSILCSEISKHENIDF